MAVLQSPRFPSKSEGKGTSWEGGTRVPSIIRWPGHIPAGSTCDKLLVTIDLFPTLASIIGGKLPEHRIDGLDVPPLIMGKPAAANPHAAYYWYYNQNELQAVSSGDGHWKLYLPHRYRTLAGRSGGSGGQAVSYRQARVTQPELYDLRNDISETTDVAARNPDVVENLLKLASQARSDLGDSLTGIQPTGNRPPGRLGN